MIINAILEQMNVLANRIAMMEKMDEAYWSLTEQYDRLEQAYRMESEDLDGGER